MMNRFGVKVSALITAAVGFVAAPGSALQEHGAPPSRSLGDERAVDRPQEPDSEGAQAQCGRIQSGSPQGTYVRCVREDPVTCMGKCAEIGANCAGMRPHAYKTDAGSGSLKQCMSNTVAHTCTYCFRNGDTCTWSFNMGLPPFALCNYTGGKGCE